MMKGKFSIVLLAVAAALCMAFGFAACAKTPSEEPAEHVHSMTKIEKIDPTCTADGAKEHWHCAVCGKDFSDEAGKEALADLTIPKLGHHMTQVEGVDPTCTADGAKEHWHCAVCGKIFSDEAGKEMLADLTIPKLGHDWSEWVSNGDATCTDDGTETRTCGREGCGASETQTRQNSALGHDYGNDGVCRREGCGDKGGPIATYRREGDKILFGSYPQSEVKDEATISSLTQQAGALPTAENAGAWTAYSYYQNKTVSSYMWYIDLMQGNEKYRGVYFTSYRPYYVELGGYASLSYQDENGYTAEQTYWFKYEPIEWRVAEQGGGVALLVADLILDSQQFYHSSLTYTEGEKQIAPNNYAESEKQIAPNNYAESDIRAWLQEDFYETAFTELQQGLIETSLVNNTASSMAAGDGIYASEDTKDKVFLLSYREATNRYYFASEDALKLKATDYAKSQGLKTEDGPQWWLRSPHRNAAYFARAIDGNGSAENFINTQNTCCGVVPALRLRLSDGSAEEEWKLSF